MRTSPRRSCASRWPEQVALLYSNASKSRVTSAVSSRRITNCVSAVF